MTHSHNIKPSTAHTAEPWQIRRLNNGWPVITCDAHDIADLRLNGNDYPFVEGNASRIVAAVNACQGISTEALERGVIAELRHILDELLTAAGDLNSAIDGVTDEFDAERARLNATIRMAHAILDGGTEFDLNELLASRGQIALVWSIEDVQEIRPDLSEEQARDVLQQVKQGHDCNDGVNWLTLELAAEELFGYAPETVAEE